jgi:hypothetical protein
MKQDFKPYEIEGLCMTCVHAGSCGYLARTEGPIWRCEEFDDSGPRTTSPGTPAMPPLRETVRESPPDEPGRFLGLCCNCDNRSSCGFFGAREAILFCEEYR